MSDCNKPHTELTGQNLVVVKVGRPKEQEADWLQWVKTHHMPSRLKLRGFLSARLYTALPHNLRDLPVSDEPLYLALYDVTGIDALQSESYMKLKAVENVQPRDDFQYYSRNTKGFAYGVYDLKSSRPDYNAPTGAFAFLTGYDVPYENVSGFNARYLNEHVPAILKVPGIVAVRQFIISKKPIAPIVGEGGYLPRCLSVYDVENTAVFENETFIRAMISQRRLVAPEPRGQVMYCAYKFIYDVISELIPNGRIDD